MALGDSNAKHGNKGSRHSYEYNSLYLLDAIKEAVSNLAIGDVNVNLTDLENLLKGIGGVQETPGAVRVSDTAGSVAAGSFGVSIANTGDVDCTVLGTTIKPGETFTYEAKVGNTLGAIAWIAPGVTSELTILETR